MAAAEHWLRQQTDASIFCASFTRRAAAEISMRLGATVGRSLISTTIHGLAREICCANYEQMGYPDPEIEIYDAEESERLMREVVEASSGRLSIRKLRQAVRNWPDGGGGPTQNALAHYVALLRRRAAIDYDLLVPYAASALRQAACRGAAPPHQMGFIDEAQDLSAEQWDMLEALRLQKLFVVGDFRQSIYRWRHADPERLRAFAASATVVELEEGYRCPPEVLQWARAAIDGELLPSTGPVSMTPQERCLAGLPAAGTVGVLTRTRQQAREAQAAIEEAGLAAVVAGQDEPVLRGPVIRLVIACACWPGYPSSHAMARQVIREYAMASQERLLEITAAASRHGMSLLEAARRRLDAVDSLYRDLPDSLLERVVRAAERVAGATGAMGRSEQEALSRMMASYLYQTAWERRDERSLHAWYVMQEEAPADQGRVQCSTIHAAKGLEFDHVILYGVSETEDGPLMAAWRSRDRMDLDEERRLLYVAATRARQTLTIGMNPQVIHSGFSGKPDNCAR